MIPFGSVVPSIVAVVLVWEVTDGDGTSARSSGYFATY